MKFTVEFYEKENGEVQVKQFIAGTEDGSQGIIHVGNIGGTRKRTQASVQ